MNAPLGDDLAEGLITEDVSGASWDDLLSDSPDQKTLQGNGVQHDEEVMQVPEGASPTASNWDALLDELESAEKRESVRCSTALVGLEEKPEEGAPRKR